MKYQKLSISMVSILALFVLTGCPPKKKMAVEDRPKDEVVLEDQTAADANAGDLEISQDWTEIASLSGVTFELNSANLNDGARTTLKGNVAVLKKLPASVTVRVEGHCDDRGTVEYNIALGQRRANAVSNFYATAGIGRSRLKTISYGEERPLCTDQSEDCWSRNRRSTTTVRNDQPVTIKGDTLK